MTGTPWETVARPPDWTRGALCAQIGGDLWFPEPAFSPELAKRLCRTCDVVDKCRQHALDHRIEHGVWGGLSEQERRELLPPLPAPVRTPVAERVEIVRRLVGQRFNDVEIGRELGLDSSTVQKLRRRNGIPSGRSMQQTRAGVR